MSFAYTQPNRGVLRLTGEDARSFLQGLISNDVERVSPSQAIYAALLTAQGKYLHDFFIAEQDGALLLDVAGDRLADLARRLGLYRLRAQVTVTDLSADYAVLVADPSRGATAEGAVLSPFHGGVAFTDPRRAALGLRAIVMKSSAEAVLAAWNGPEGDEADYHRLRIDEGVPDGGRDLIIDKSILLENGFDELNGIDWKKGCYVGQELTARTKYRGLIKKRLMPVEVDGPLPEPGTLLMANGVEAGELRGGIDGQALALVRLDALDKAPFAAGEARVTPRQPEWLKL